MNTNRSRWTRAIAVGMLALGLGLSGVARAQDGDYAEEGEASEGRSLDGYFGTGIMAVLAVFIIGKSARR
ncbi:hypothetical protein [Paludisphaera sp.]|uniref:hypothetical protein n=1 Tax=Paludisphaera sp. TaxID=2017432 RepID=UPI00301C6979